MKNKNKKNKNKVLVFFVVLSVLLVCFSGICSYAKEYHTHTEFVEEHFDWVQNSGSDIADGIVSHYPSNPMGSCVYTAMSLLLSFYDAYWDDRFVPDDYESIGLIDNETGNIWREYHLDLENDAWDSLLNSYLEASVGISSIDEIPDIEKKILYDQFIEDGKREFFHLYLISLGKERGYHDDDPLDYGMYDKDTVDFLDYYLRDICHFADSEGKVEVKMETEGDSTSREDLFEIAKQQIEAGFPVIYTGSRIKNTDSNTDNGDGEKSGHVMLLYKLTEDGQDIVLSRCWNKEETQTFYNNDYDLTPTIIYLDVKNLQHTCSDNYFTQTHNGEGFCVCEIFSEHPNHEHEYSVTAYSDNMHWKKCLCGDSQQREYHQLEFLYNFANQHVYGCEAKECNYELMVDHLPIYTSVSSSLHSVKCDNCSYTELEAHTFRPSENPRYYRCIYCGYTRDEFGGGGNIIMGKKEDEIE